MSTSKHGVKVSFPNVSPLISIFVNLGSMDIPILINFIGSYLETSTAYGVRTLKFIKCIHHMKRVGFQYNILRGF